MNYQEIEKLQSDLWAKMSSLKNEHEQLKTELKQLSQELAITFNSSRKFEILQQMNKIEEKIKQDLKSFKNQQYFIENEKRKIRMQEYETQRKIAINKTAQIKDKIKAIESKTQEIPYKTETESLSELKFPKLQKIKLLNSDNVNDNLKNLELMIESLGEETFLSLATKVENRVIKLTDTSLKFQILYDIWMQLERVEIEIKKTRELIDSSQKTDIIDIEASNIQTPENNNDYEEEPIEVINIEEVTLITENESINTNLNLENKSRLKFDMEEVKKQAAFLWDLAYNQNEILITENDQPLFKIIPCKKTN